LLVSLLKRVMQVTVRNDRDGGSDRRVNNINESPRHAASQQVEEEHSDEAMRTLWVGGLSEKTEEDVLYELFLNAGPLARIHQPADKETKKKKQFAFVVFQDRESIRYAYELLNGVELYGNRLRLQHKETGLGINICRMPNPSHFHGGGGGGRDRGGGGGHHRSFSTSSLPRMDGGRRNHDGPPLPPPQQLPPLPPSPQQVMMQQPNFNMGYNNGYGGGRGHGYGQDQGYSNRDRSFDNGFASPGFAPPRRDYDSHDRRDYDAHDRRDYDAHDRRGGQRDYDRRDRFVDDRSSGRGGDRHGDDRRSNDRYNDRGSRDHDFRDRSHDRSSRR